ncbi:MAG: hypothetical protein WKF34_03040 [Pyrinomonadaceae bacterium]
MLWTAGFPLFLLFFVVVLGFFVWKVFSPDSRNGNRRIFEFYLTANEILRDDDRQWFGFEIEDAINLGESILKSATAPPLVYFALGSLHQKLGDHSAAFNRLSFAIDADTGDETSIVIASRELREHAAMLRRIQRSPTEAPLTSAAIRSLQRARKTRGPALLAASRRRLEETEHEFRTEPTRDADTHFLNCESSYSAVDTAGTSSATNGHTAAGMGKREVTGDLEIGELPGERQTISEVLHDIYDKKAS